MTDSSHPLCLLFRLGSTPLSAAQAANDLQKDDVIALLADNGLYWTRGSGNPPPIEAASHDANQTWSQFTVVTNPNGSISLRQLDENYLTITHRKDSDAIEARPTITNDDAVWRQFELTSSPDGGTFFKASCNNLFLSRINRDGRDPIEAAKGSMDFFCEFKAVIIRFAGDNPQSSPLAELKGHAATAPH